jgi:hypothetical protein
MGATLVGSVAIHQIRAMLAAPCCPWHARCCQHSHGSKTAVMRCNQPHLRKAACDVGHAAQDALLTNTLTLTSEMARSLTASGVSAKNSSRNLHARQPGGRYSVRWEASAGMVRCGWELVSACWMNSGLTTCLQAVLAQCSGQARNTHSHTPCAELRHQSGRMQV